MTARLLAFVALSFAAAPAGAQSPFPQDATAPFPLASALGRGDASTAVVDAEGAFHVNPALLARLELARPTIQLAGVGGANGGSAWSLWKYYRDELGPAIEDGLDSLRVNDRDRFEALYDDALELGRSPSSLSAMAAGPSLQYRINPVTALQVGIFAVSSARGQVHDGGAGVPLIDFYDQTDVHVPVGIGMAMPGSSLAFGVSASAVRRWVTAKYAFVDELDAGGEALYVLSGTGVALDAGVHARDVGSPGLDLGASVRLGGDPALSYSRRIEVSGTDFPDNEAEIAELEARFADRDPDVRYRAGLAYRVPTEDLPEGVAGALIAIDYVGASTSAFDQSTMAHMRFGMEATGGPLTLRAGFAQGYPSFGAGVRTGALRLDYAFFGVEEGRRSSQLRRGVHMLQARFGLGM